MRLRAGIVAGIWLFLLVRFSQPQWLPTPEGFVFAVADDVYITADYARTFAAGHGLRWFPQGPRVEGITSPLWAFVLTPFHLVPHHDEHWLGLYVVALNAVLLAMTAYWLARLLEPIFDASDGRPGRARGVLAWAFVVAAPFAAAALVWWSAQGFEVALVALLSVMSFAEALEPPERLRERRIAVLLGLAFWTRMDAMMTCAPALLLVLWKLRASRRAFRFAGWLAAFAAFLILSRKLYYGEWLPNTYYLKITGWPLAKRLPFGFFQNRVALYYYLFAGVPFLAFAWRSLPVATRPYLLGLLPSFLTLLYSTHNGGDFAWIAIGYDRHCAAALPLLVFSIGAVLFSVRSDAKIRVLLAALGTAFAFGPVSGRWITGISMNDGKLLQALNPASRVPQDTFLGWIISDAMLAKLVTHPPARFAVCAAGAAVYFSHRDGVDVLGKNDPHVAHLAAADRRGPDSRCFRSFAPSGHNKEDIGYSFTHFTPDISVVEPPAISRDRYVSFVVGGHKFFGLDGSDAIDWTQVKDVNRL
jgi:hypothetical protein